MVERRQHPRYRLTSEVTGKVKSTMDVELIDISEGGLLVETKLGLPPASFCELKFSLHGSEMSFHARVLRCRAQLNKTTTGCKVAYRSGLEFINLDERQLAVVRKMIDTCCDNGSGVEGPAAADQAVPVEERSLTA
jgi:hypothetical protein